MDHNAAVNVLIDESNRSPTRSLGELPFSIGRESPVESREVVRLRDGSADAWTLWVLKCIVYALVLKQSGFSDGVSAGLALAICVLMFVIREIVRSFGSERVLRSIDVPKHPNSRARVACVGPHWMVARCVKHWNKGWGTELQDRAFRGVVGRDVAVQLRSPWAALMLVLQILTWIVLVALGTSQPVISWMVLFGILAILCARTIFVYAIRPVGMRVRPGVLEVVRFGRLGRGPQVVAAINLYEAAVLVDGNESVLFVAHNGVTQEFDFIDVINKQRFMRAVLRAANSSPSAHPDAGDQTPSVGKIARRQTELPHTAVVIPGTPIVVGRRADIDVGRLFVAGQLARLVQNAQFMALIMGVLLFVNTLIRTTLTLDSVTQTIGISFLAVMAIGLVFWLFSGPSRKIVTVGQEQVEVPEYPSWGARVGIVGGPDLLQRLFHDDELRDGTFEPIVYPANGLLLPTWPQWICWVMFTAVIGALGLWVKDVFPELGKHPELTIGMFAVGLGGVLVWWLLPQSIRIVPGRLDLMTGGVLGLHLRTHKSFDLRTLAILIDLNSFGIVMSDPDKRVLEVALPFGTSGIDMARDILRASIAQEQPATLLPDRFVD